MPSQMLNWQSQKSMKGCFKEEERMAKIYANLINKGLKTIEDVPENLREAVEALLAE